MTNSNIFNFAPCNLATCNEITERVYTVEAIIGHFVEQNPQLAQISWRLLLLHTIYNDII